VKDIKTNITIPEEILLKILRIAVKAPSGHNTQAWKFDVYNEYIEIRPDYSRTLPAADPEHYELYISLGCALENTVIAAAYYGYEAKSEIKSDADGFFVQIRLNKNDDITKPDLFAYIDKRQSTRNAYLDKSVPEEALKRLNDFSKPEGINLRMLLSGSEIDRLRPYIKAALEKQFSNSDLKKELARWMRYSEKEAMRKGDGLWVACNGLPAMGRFIGRLVIKYMVSAKSENKRWQKLIGNTAGFALFSVEKHEPEHWIKLGRAFQHFALLSAQTGLKHAHVNMPCQVPEVRSQMASDFGTVPAVPLLLIRFGYSKAMPYSYRRNVHEFIDG
jgi:hypothetical protein